MHIRIVRRPDGEAPESVREAWVGLVLPVVSDLQESVNLRTSGVRSGPRNVFSSLVFVLLRRGTKKRGYAVDTAEALDILEKKNSAAARWWRTNAEHLVRLKKALLFQEDCCVVEEPPDGSPLNVDEA